MTYNFFADKVDKLKILDFVFKDTDLQVYDHYSALGQEICEYKTSDEISSKFDLVNGSDFAVTFQLWSPRHKGRPIFRRIDLDPKFSNGYTFRYTTEGWGLIQLFFGGLNSNALKQSHIGHFNEKGALKWENPNALNELVRSWDWPEIQVTSRKLKYQIHNKMATRKIGTYGVLFGAYELEKQGIKLS